MICIDVVRCVYMRSCVPVICVSSCRRRPSPAHLPPGSSRWLKDKHESHFIQCWIASVARNVVLFECMMCYF